MKITQNASNPFNRPIKTNHHSYPLFGQSGRYVSFEPAEAPTKKGSVSQLMETLFSGKKSDDSYHLDFHA